MPLPCTDNSIISADRLLTALYPRGEGGETMEPYTITDYGVLVDGVEYATYQDYLDTLADDDGS